MLGHLSQIGSEVNSAEFGRLTSGYSSDSEVEVLIPGNASSTHDNPSSKNESSNMNPEIDASLLRDEESGHKIYVIARLISWQPFPSKRIRIGPRRDYFSFPTHPPWYSSLN